MWIAIILFWVLLSILAGAGARNKGHSFVGYFLLSLVLSPLVGLIVMAVVKPAKPEAEEKTEIEEKLVEPEKPKSE
jgi:Na+/H+-dicarboxylate symporter